MMSHLEQTRTSVPSGASPACTGALLSQIPQNLKSSLSYQQNSSEVVRMILVVKTSVM